MGYCSLFVAGSPEPYDDNGNSPTLLNNNPLNLGGYKQTIIMVLYPDCPYCNNTALSIVDVEINGVTLKGVQCNDCKKFCGFFQDVKAQLDELKEKVDSLEGDVSELIQ